MGQVLGWMVVVVATWGLVACLHACLCCLASPRPCAPGVRFPLKDLGGAVCWVRWVLCCHPSHPPIPSPSIHHLALLSPPRSPSSPRRDIHTTASHPVSPTPLTPSLSTPPGTAPCHYATNTGIPPDSIGGIDDDRFVPAPNRLRGRSWSAGAVPMERVAK